MWTHCELHVDWSGKYRLNHCLYSRLVAKLTRCLTRAHGFFVAVYVTM